MMQGLMQRSSHASMRLKNKSAKLYAVLQRNGNLQLLYFVLEKPLEKHIEAVSAAERNIMQFHSTINNNYKLK